MLIETEQLKVGDEILILSQQPRYLKIMEPLRESKAASWNNKKRFIAVKCLVNVTATTYNNTRWDFAKQTHVPYTYISRSYILSPPNDNSSIEKFDLNYKQLWLIKREQV